jgi:hypothetical protein
MGFESDFDEKIDVIDLIINVLKDHEKKLDELVSRLENTDSVETPRHEPPTRAPQMKAVSGGKPVASVLLKRWTEFQRQARSSELVAFDSDEGRFTVSALAGRVIYNYVESIPSMEIEYSGDEGKSRIDGININGAELIPAAFRGKLDCGLDAFRGKLDCGLELKTNKYDATRPDGGIVYKIKYYIDPEIAKQWLAYQLAVDDDRVVQGELKPT